ncbi:MAG TPA: glycosyltransferase, partial [Longimicrobiaceae bacterium]|nr:glycosyltransferase [Longimicrobiaceae bacterium]
SLDRVVVVDDASAPPAGPGLRAALGDDAPPGLEVVRREAPRGPTAARNQVVEEARTGLVLQLDDDALIVSAEAVERAVAVMEADPSVAAVAFAQADEAGRPWPAAVQPAPVGYRCQVAAFIGFAALLRRSAFLEVGGYRELLGIHGEEKDLCIRLLDRGWRVVYLPDAPAGHVADMANRDFREYLHRAVRNDVLSAVQNEPLPMMAATLPARLSRYFRMRGETEDPGGFGRLVRRLAADLPAAWRERRPVRWSTIRRWRRLSREWPRYDGPGGGE